MQNETQTILQNISWKKIAKIYFSFACRPNHVRRAYTGAFSDIIPGYVIVSIRLTGPISKNTFYASDSDRYRWKRDAFSARSSASASDR